MEKQSEQIRRHVGDKAAATAGAFSFVYGRGWLPHKTMQAAERARKRDVAAFVERHGGGEPQSIVRGPLNAKAGTVHAYWRA